ncbi:hypothetical protein GMDG_02439 [Pseudogymnoascus destructans 20631-21]|uniref:endo-polygalacturonase n=1 Tax=Pseudogymnoascus destructans (strain ATCC MYA-4855 / 20631-21) TaxID=658429 RepID=L8G274_PSED2|nr:hypothetical protein GMDG_02439 [Pseudogymnoascus destructans 20631-21]
MKYSIFAVIPLALGASAGTPCTVTKYVSISSAVASCTEIVLSNIVAPASSAIDLSKLKTGAKVIFVGKTTFEKTPVSSFDPITIGGTKFTITGAAGHVIDGNGQAYWDGLGSNGGVAEPNHFVVVKNTVDSVISNLNIQNWPVHCFTISGGSGLTLSNINLDNSAGNAPNSASNGLAAAHNSDGFDISSTRGLTLENSVVNNQDDCVAHRFYWSKSNNVVDGVTFSNSIISNSENGCRIKTNSGTTGTVKNVVYSGITLKGIAKYGIDVQQDYLNGGPTGVPTNGVDISGITFKNVKGTVASSAYNYYILCIIQTKFSPLLEKQQHRSSEVSW